MQKFSNIAQPMYNYHTKQLSVNGGVVIEHN